MGTRLFWRKYLYTELSFASPVLGTLALNTLEKLRGVQRGSCHCGAVISRDVSHSIAELTHAGAGGDPGRLIPAAGGWGPLPWEEWVVGDHGDVERPRGLRMHWIVEAAEVLPRSGPFLEQIGGLRPVLFKRWRGHEPGVP